MYWHGNLSGVVPIQLDVFRQYGDAINLLGGARTAQFPVAAGLVPFVQGAIDRSVAAHEGQNQVLGFADFLVSLQSLTGVSGSVEHLTLVRH